MDVKTIKKKLSALHEATGPRRKYPDAKGGWMVFPECEYTFYGYAAVIDSDFGQFGNLLEMMGVPFLPKQASMGFQIAWS